METSHFEEEIRSNLSTLGIGEDSLEAIALEVEDFAWDNNIDDPVVAVKQYIEQF